MSAMMVMLKYQYNNLTILLQVNVLQNYCVIMRHHIIHVCQHFLV